VTLGFGSLFGAAVKAVRQAVRRVLPA